ncbi:hypothetical protein EDC01DRAFT_257839 [Geopyxis carbonaria]|nr:hypothetical protein EDC01DRAFT_257839 [Geopyxis carbonaria]
MVSPPSLVLFPLLLRLYGDLVLLHLWSDLSKRVSILVRISAFAHTYPAGLPRLSCFWIGSAPLNTITGRCLANDLFDFIPLGI